MADTKISALAAITAPASTDILAAVQGGTSKSMTLAHARGLLGHVLLGGADDNFGPIIFPSTITRIWGHALIIAGGALVPRLRLGSASAIDTGNNYAASNALPNANAVTSTTFNAWNLIVAAMANGNETLIEFEIVKPAAARVARGVWIGSNISVAVGTAPTQHTGAGIWVNTADLMGRLDVLGFSALTGTTPANFSTGSELTVYGTSE